MRGVMCCFVVLALFSVSTQAAEQSTSVTLGVNAFLNLDTGAAASTGADILWNGTVLAPRGHAGLYNVGKKGPRAFKFIPARYAATAPYSATPIPASALVVGDIFGVRTNGGSLVKVLVTEVSGASLTLQYALVRAGAARVKPAAAGGPPAITQLQNNYSYLLPAVPNYGIAPGSLFVIIGTGLSSSAPPVLQSSAAPGLPLTLNQTSVSVTVGGTTTTPALYYTSATQLAAVLPSTTPVGNGTITVTYQGTPSAKFPIQVVPIALGLDTLYGTGTGSGVATDANGKVFGFTNSAMPLQEIVLWGSGIGADPSNDDRTFPQKQDNLNSLPFQVFVGGRSAQVIYQGRSQYPGVDQINVMIPGGVSPGCFVSVVAQSGSIASNPVTIPINPGGGICSDPALGLNGTVLQALAASGNTPVNSAALAIAQLNFFDGSANFVAVAALTSFTTAEFGAGYTYASQGSCTVAAPGFSFNSLFGVNDLDAGKIQVTGPGGVETLQEAGEHTGILASQLPGTLTPGTYTFSATGGKDLKAFNVALDVGTPLTLTNKAAFNTVNRSLGLIVNWTGGFTNGDVVVAGVSTGGAVGVGFYCYAPSSAGQLTVPPSILLSVPPGSGKLTIFNFTAPQTVPGVAFSLAEAAVGFQFFNTLQ